MKKIKNYLKKYAPIYKPFHFVYWRYRAIKEHILGTKALEIYWAKRHLKGGNDWNNPKYTDKKNDWVLSYWDSQNHPHRQLLLKCIKEFTPINSILEIGANCGPNLYLIAKKFPFAKIIGVDINKKAVEIGKRLFKEKNISNVKLLLAKANELKQFQDKSFDIVFTDATLIYIGPDKIKKVISEMIRIAKKGIILLEQHIEGQKDFDGKGVYYFGIWQRNYKNLLQKFVSENQIRFVKIPKELWQDKNWSKSGYIIEVTL